LRNKQRQECIYWLLIQEYDPRTKQLKAIVQFKPTKVQNILNTKSFQYMWYKDTINLAEDIIHRQFNWQAKPQN
jgi:hypothetical protein